MKLVTFSDSGPARAGIWEGDAVVDAGVVLGRGPTSMLELIQDGWDPRSVGPDFLSRSEKLPFSSVLLHAPIPRPHANVICIGRNYAEHAAESARASGEAIGRPTFFSKAVTTVIGPYDDVPVDARLSSQIDWEVELAVVIGKKARNVSRSKALDYVFGYMVLNDVSARDLQYGYGGQFFFGKSLDRSCPTGPCVVTADEIRDPQSLALEFRVNGAIKQSAHTSDMIFDVAQLIETLSAGLTLEPGQIIATGTPAGVGHARQPPEFLRPGDVMESRIEGIGSMSNGVVDASTE